MAEANQGAVRLVEPYVQQAIASAIAGALAEDGAVAVAIKNAIGEFFAGSGETLPTAKSGKVGSIFIKSGDGAGAYVCTATETSTSTWTALATVADIATHAAIAAGETSGTVHPGASS
jgi:hypothetical protein